MYRDKNDSLGFHKDKMLDLADQSVILSISFGAARPIQFFEAGGRRRHVVVLQPGSLLAIGPETNNCFEHGIPKVHSEVAPRISLSVRQSSSFVNAGDGKIEGKGHEYQTANYPFIESYDDSKTYSVESQLQMSRVQQEAAEQMVELRSKF